MKIGTSLMIVVAILISFGYILSDNIHVREDLQDVTGKIDEANLLTAKVTKDLQTCQATIFDQNAKLQSLQTVISSQLESNSELEAQNKELSDENEKLRSFQSSKALVNMDPIAAIVIVVTQIVLALGRKMKLGFQLPLANQPKKGQSVRLTKEELEVIIKMRRKK